MKRLAAPKSRSFVALRLTCLVAVVFWWFAQLAVARAATGWLEPVELLSGAGDIRISHLSSAGEAAIAVFPGAELSGEDRIIVREPTGAWSAAENVSAGSGNGRASVAVNENGEGMAVWPCRSMLRALLCASRRPAGGQWSVPSELLSADNQGSPFPWDGGAVAIDASGRVIVVWLNVQVDRDGEPTVQAAFSPAGSGSTDAETVARRSRPGINSWDIEAALDEQGNAFAAWNEDVENVGEVWAAARSATGAWEPAKQVSPVGRHCNLWQLAAGGQGSATVAGDCGQSTMWLATKLPHGGWSEAGLQQSPVDGALLADLAFGRGGDAAAVWKKTVADELDRVQGERVFITVRPPGGGWSAPDYEIERIFGTSVPALRFDRWGDLFAIGPRSVDRSATGEKKLDEVIMQAAAKLAGGPWIPLAESKPVLHPKLVPDAGKGAADDPVKEQVGYMTAIGSDNDALILGGGYDHGRKGFADAYAYEGGRLDGDRIASVDGFLFKAALMPPKPGAAATLRLVAGQTARWARRLKTIKVRFGSEPALRVRRSRLFASGAARRRGKAFGRLVLSPLGGRRVAASLVARRGRIEIDPAVSSSSLKRRKLRRVVRTLRTKTRLRITRAGLTLRKLPGQRYRRIRISLLGRKSGLLRTPNRCEPIVFYGKFVPTVGNAVQAAARVPRKCSSSIVKRPGGAGTRIWVR